jgi:hypothetical protein
MKNALVFFGFLLLISCTNSKKESDYVPLVYSIDTVHINSMGEHLDLRRLLLISDLDFDKKSIFSYNEFDHSLDEIDLDKKAFVKKYAFEKEGPNGTGDSFYNFNVLKNGDFYIQYYDQYGVFNKNGDLRKRIDWMNSKDSTGTQYGEIPGRQVLVESDGLKVYGIGYDYDKKEIYIDVLSVQEGVFKRLNINSKKSYTDLILSLDDASISIEPHVDLEVVNNKILLGYEFSNEIVLVDPNTDLLTFKDYDPKLTSKIVKGPAGKHMGSREEIQKGFQEYMEQVEFDPPVWDELNKRYLRLSKSIVFHESKNERALLPEEKEVKVFLSVFDENFKLLDEIRIPELSYMYGKYFAKDGKLWVSQNFSDELGFIVVDYTD